MLNSQPLPMGDASRPQVTDVSRLVKEAENALQEGQLQVAQHFLATFFAEVNRYHGLSTKAEPVDQFVIRAQFAAGQLVSKLSSSCKGQRLIDAVLEAIRHIMRGIELAAANARYSHLVYNGSVYYWHAARPLHCDKLRRHLLQSQEKVCQALDKVDGQPAWKVQQLMALALCQLEEQGKPDDVQKTLAKALELASTAKLGALRAKVLALQTHQQTVAAAQAAAAKPGGPAAAGKAAGAAGAPPPPAAAAAGAAAAAKMAAPAGKRKPGDASATAAPGKVDVDGALAVLQWVLSAKPDVVIAEQQLQAALKLVDVKQDKSSPGTQLQAVGRIGWGAAVCGAAQLAEQCRRKAAASQDLGPRAWSDLTGLLLSLQAAPPATLSSGNDSSGSGAGLATAALRARRDVLEGMEEAVSAFVKLGDVEGVHNCAVLAWNAALPLLQPSHRGLVKAAFTAVAKALEAVGSPWAQLRAALHLEVAKAEADADCFIKAAKEVNTAMSLNYPSSADVVAACGYERPLDRYLEPMARAAELRGVAPVQLSSSCSDGALDTTPRGDDDVVLLLERARDSKSVPLRAEYLQKALNKLLLLPPVQPPSQPPSTGALQQQLKAARTRTQLWADFVQLAWQPGQLDALVRSALPVVLGMDWEACGDKEMLILQARTALLGVDAGKAALAKLGAEVALPASYIPHQFLQRPHQLSPTTGITPSAQQGHQASTAINRGRSSTGSQGLANTHQEPSHAVAELQGMIADLTLQAMRLGVAAKGNGWLVMNAALAAWNSYLPLMQRGRYAELAAVLLPLLQQLLKETSVLEPNQLVMLAEAAAKATEHMALLNAIQQKERKQQQMHETSQLSAAATQDKPDAQGIDKLSDVRPGFCQVDATSGCKPLAEARAATAGWDIAQLLGETPEVLQLLSDTAAACQAALARAAAAAEPQALIQAYARLQQLQGKPVTVPAGLPPSMADTSRLLALIEGLIANAPGSTAAPAQPVSAAPVAGGAAAGRASSAASATTAATGRGSTTGGKGAAAAPVMSKAEQDIRMCMSLLAGMPSVNLQLWAQLSRAAGAHGFWMLARECAQAAVTALPADRQDLSAVVSAADVPGLSAQSWYWLSLAEMQQGQAVLSLLPAATGSGPAASLSLQHDALRHFATAARLGSFIHKADPTEAAARLAYNAAIAAGGLLASDVTRAAAVPALRKVAVSLNSTRPSDIGFQVQVNVLLLECLAAAGRWSEAKRHADALHRSLPASKQRGLAAAAALEALAGWRATCLVRAASGREQEEMTRLQSELSTPQLKARAWLAYAQASRCPKDQLSGRQSAIAALERLGAAAMVEHLLEFAHWLATCPSVEADVTPEQLLLQACAAMQPATGSSRPTIEDNCANDGDDENAAGSSKVLPAAMPGLKGISTEAPDSTAPSVPRGSLRSTRSTADTATCPSTGPSPAEVQRYDRLIRANLLLAQVAADAADRRQHLLQAQAHAQDLLCRALMAAGAEAAVSPCPGCVLQQEPEQLADVSEGPSTACSAPGEAETAAVASPDGGIAACQGAGAADDPEGSGLQAQGTSAAVPPLQLPSRPAMAAPAHSLAAVQYAAAHVTSSDKLPSNPVGWATWLPTDTVLQQLKSNAAAAPADSVCTDAKGQAAPSAGPAGQRVNAAKNASCSEGAFPATGAAAASGGFLGRSSMLSPELLLAHLRELSELLQTAGLHVEALCVVQLARLVAAVTLDCEATTGAVTLEMSSLCELLGLSAAAADWLELAQADCWPTQQQVQQANQDIAVKQLVQEFLQCQGQSRPATGVSSSAGGAASGASSSANTAQHAAFLQHALQEADPSTIQAWRQRSSSDGSVIALGSGMSSSSSSCTAVLHRPSSAAAAARAAAAGSVQHASFCALPLKPVAASESWISMARYLVDHAQYTSAQRLCSMAVDVSRSCHDTASEAQVLLLKARLALLAQHHEKAACLAQAAQALGASIRSWQDSVLCYAAARSCMDGRGPADAQEALEAGVDLMATVSRGCGTSFRPAVLGASSCLRLHLSQLLAVKAVRSMQEDPSSSKMAARLSAQAVTLAETAAAEAGQAGAMLLQARALQQAANLLLNNPASASAKLQRCRSPHSAQVRLPSSPAFTPKAVLLTALQHLQAARKVLMPPPSDLAAGLEAAACSLNTSQQQQQQQQQQEQAPSQLTSTASGTKQSTAHVSTWQHCSTPAARLAASLLLDTARVELSLARLQLCAARPIPEAVQLYPRVEGRDASAVIAFLTAGAAAGSSQDQSSSTGYLEQCVQSASQAVVEAAACSEPGLHAAALVVLGQAHMLLAQQAMLVAQQGGNTAGWQPPTSDSSSFSDGCTGNGDAIACADAWLPWASCGVHPGGRVAYTELAPGSSSQAGGIAAAGQATESASSTVLPETAAPTGVEQAPADGCQAQSPQQQQQHALPPAAAQSLQQAAKLLQDALQQALQSQLLPVAEAAAHMLLHCYGRHQPETAALYLAVAQSCRAAAAMQRCFQEAASLQHPEVLLLRQVQQLQQLSPGGSVHEHQALQMLGLLGTTYKRLQVSQPQALLAMLSQLQPQQRVLLLHHDPDAQQLVAAAWGVSSTAAEAAAIDAVTPAVSSSGATNSTRARRSSVKEAAAAAQAEAASRCPAEPPPALLASMPCTQQQLQDLAAAFAAYSRQLHKVIIDVTGQPVPGAVQPGPEGAAGAAAGPAAAAGPKKPAAGAAGKAGPKDKGGKEGVVEVPQWVPPVPVFPAELNTEWQRLVQQFAELLQPLSAMMRDALQHSPTAAAAAPTAVKAGGKAASSSGAKAGATANAAQPLQVALQLVLEPDLCELPWEALPVLARSCCSIARCFSLALLQQLQQPPEASAQAAGAGKVAASDAAPAGGAAGHHALLDLSKMTYLVDPHHHMSSAAERPGCYAAPLVPCFRRQLQEVWGQGWQGFSGSDCQSPSEQQLLRALVSSKGLLVLTPGRLLGHIGTQALTALDLTSCTAALLFDRADSTDAATYQTKADNRKTAAQRALEGPCQTAMLLLLRGVRSVVLAALPGTPHTHMHLAGNVLRALTGSQLQQPQAPVSNRVPSRTADTAGSGSSSSLSSGDAGYVDNEDFFLSTATTPVPLAEAAWGAQRRSMAGFELQALTDAGLVVYGLPSVVVSEAGGSSSKPKPQRKG